MDISDGQSLLEGESQGEVALIAERLVISHVSGRFHLPESPRWESTGGLVRPGDLLGMVGDYEIRSPIRGFLIKIMALPGEPISINAPVACLLPA